MIIFFGNNKKDKDVRLTDKQYKDLVGGMSRKERKEFERHQDQLRRDREDDKFDVAIAKIALFTVNFTLF
ncbi:hypothetical protein SAMN04487928_1444 [Butyrivibrio proteoclasticus]|uniref:Uncharacterized protein n=1 Tax=Butyrivibrio proteoclasticus TaxID=43305 RepID=A0A1I5YCU4_9FIRM|nr:hypothetical protein [Butyrivibrio proteoclasticus]SFQ42044.1 hypothetical protein SAMN04487928_1444 [Butyrivibrio proteoclasticus]